MGNGSVVANQAMASREMIEDFIVIALENKFRTAHFLTQSNRGTGAVVRRNDGYVGVVHERSRERDIVGERPFGGVPEIRSGDDGDAKFFSTWWSFGVEEVGLIKRHCAELLHEEEVVAHAVFDRADGTYDFHRMSEVGEEVPFGSAHSDWNERAGKSTCRRIVFPGDGLGKFNSQIFDNLTKVSCRGVGIVCDYFVDFLDFSPEWSDVFGSEDHDGAIWIGIVNSADCRNAEAGFVDRIWRGDGDISSVNLRERLI